MLRLYFLLHFSVSSASFTTFLFFLTLKTLLAIAHKIVDIGFKAIPKRWIVERTFGWFNNFRRMSKNYEHNPKTSEHIIYINMIAIMLKRLAEP